MKKLITWWENLKKEDLEKVRVDKLNNIIHTLFNETETEETITLFNEVSNRFNLLLAERKERITREQEAIDKQLV
jgi:hypothetical protein